MYDRKSYFVDNCRILLGWANNMCRSIDGSQEKNCLYKWMLIGLVAVTKNSKRPDWGWFDSLICQ